MSYLNCEEILIIFHARNFFRNDTTQVLVTIDRTECSIVSSKVDQITCLTGAHQSASGTFPILVFIKNVGFAINVR